MDAPRVNILLSAYNGEKYIDEQLQSLFAQDYPNLRIYVRDDGSTDATPDILRAYEKQGKLILLTGENTGFCRSFFILLEEAKEGQYWSFCDQDDIWRTDKVRRAVEFLERERAKSESPLLYYGCSEMIDENGKSLGLEKAPKGSVCFRRALTGTFGQGFAMVINQPVRERMLRCCAERVHSHDWLAGAIALGLGKVIVDEQICAYYRRLDTSVSRISFGKRIGWFLNMLKGDGDVKERNLEFSRVFYEELPAENRKWMRLFDRESYSLKASLIKCFYPKRWRPSLSSEAAMRILMATGKV